MRLEKVYMDDRDVGVDGWPLTRMEEDDEAAATAQTVVLFERLYESRRDGVSRLGMVVVYTVPFESCAIRLRGVTCNSFVAKSPSSSSSS